MGNKFTISKATFTPPSNSALPNFAQPNLYYTSWDMNYTAEYGDLEQVKSLHSKGIKGSDWAIDYAAKNGHLEVVKFLVSTGTKFTTNTINWAEKNGHTEIVNYLRSIPWK